MHDRKLVKWLYKWSMHKKISRSFDICNGNSYYMDIFKNKVDIWTLVAHSSVGKNIFII